MSKKKSELTKVGCVIVMSEGCLESVSTFTDAKDAEEAFEEACVAVSNEWEPYDADSHIDDGHYENGSGDEIFLSLS